MCVCSCDVAWCGCHCCFYRLNSWMRCSAAPVVIYSHRIVPIESKRVILFWFKYTEQLPTTTAVDVLFLKKKKTSKDDDVTMCSAIIECVIARCQSNRNPKCVCFCFSLKFPILLIMNMYFGLPFSPIQSTEFTSNGIKLNAMITTAEVAAAISSSQQQQSAMFNMMAIRTFRLRTNSELLKNRFRMQWSGSIDCLCAHARE